MTVYLSLVICRTSDVATRVMNRWNEESVCLPIETIETIHDTFKPAILLLIQWWWNNLLLFYTSYSYYLTLIRPINEW